MNKSTNLLTTKYEPQYDLNDNAIEPMLLTK